METRAHFVLIGAFTLLSIAGAFALVLFFSGQGIVSSRKAYEVVFSGTVSGLARGGGVTFNGLRVGEVTAIGLVPDDPSRVAAYIQVDPGVPIKADTTARLETQGLAGATVIALVGGAPDSADLQGKDGQPPILLGEPSQLQNLLENVASLSAKADALLAKADKLMSENSEAISDTVKNIDAFSKALSDNASGLSGALASIAELSRRATPLADRLSKLADDADAAMKAVDPDKVKAIVGNISDFTAWLGDSKGEVKSLIADSASLAKRLNDASDKLDGTIGDIDNLVKSVDTSKVASFMNGADAIGATLSENRDTIDEAIKNASELSAKLDRSADKLDGLITSLQGFLGSSDVKGPLAEVGDAAKSLRQLADDVDVRAKEISVGLIRFSSGGLRDYEALAIEGRHTIDDLDRLLRSIEKNPTQLIFGSKSK